MNLTGLTELVHFILTQKITAGDSVIDATAGNGNDTLLLAELTGPRGLVYAFDIQQSALDKVKMKLEESGLSEQVKLILDDHKNMNKYVKNKIKAVTFNLGYLPDSQGIITTTIDSTVSAIEKSLELLDKDGIITIVAYTSHQGGLTESEEVEKYLSQVNIKKIVVSKYSFLNNNKNAPALFIVNKK